MIIPVVFGALLLGRAFDMKNAVSPQVFIFDQADVEANKQVIPRTFTQSNYRFLESSSEANDFLNIDGEFSLKVKNDQFKIQGLGTYLKKTINRDKTVEMLITVYHETLTETFPSYTKLLTDWQKLSPAEVGTHYIRSITYGGQLIISYQLTAIESEYLEDIKAAVNANLAISGSFTGDVKGNLEMLSKAVEKKAYITITATGTTGAIAPPQNLEELFKLVDEYPEMVNKINKGKGSPLKLEIVELSTLQPDFTAFLKNYALDAMLNDATNKYDDLIVSMKMYRDWENKGGIWPHEKDKEINEYQSRLKKANRAMSNAISELDPTGGFDQFDEAFKVYGEGGDNIPNRYTRDLQRLIHFVEEKPFYWYPYTKAVSYYIHWGGKECSLPNPDPLFIGYAATTPTKFGNGGSVECLRNTEPSLEKGKISSKTIVSYINGLGFETPEKKTGQVFCAFCKLENATTVYTISGRTECPPELKLEYSGYMSANKDTGTASDFICMDIHPVEEIPPESTAVGEHSGKLVPVRMECPDCEEDEQNKYVSCVVCSR